MLTLAIALSASACSGTNGGGDAKDGKVTLRWSTWGSAEDMAVFKAFTDEFTKKHPNITLKLEPVASYEDYHPKLLTQLTSRTAPDVFYVGDDYIGKLVADGVLAPLDEQLAGPDSKSRPADFFEGIYGGAKKSGVTYGVPNDTNPEVLWFDKKALAEAGITEDPAALNEAGRWTMATYLEMNAKLKAADKYGSIFWNWYGANYSLVNGFGGKVWENGKYVATTDPKSRQALKVLADGYRDKTFASADLLPEGNSASTQFIKHKAGFYAGGRWVVETIRKGGDLPNYDIVPFPSESGQPVQGAVAASYLTLNKDGKHKKEAFTFLTEFVSKEGQQLRLKGGSAVPSVKGAESLVTGDGYPAHAQTFLDVRDKGFANFPDEVAVPGLTKAVNDHLMKIWEGKLGFDEGMTQLQTLVDGMKGRQS
ncbi:multiple sugar transport system substrate-binding protein [Kitasatospora gansuensis]|uniref:Multiple sugar transport system substrate-binding protein n=1 Tax=Kitasatospora gansuensis TaxID=258050 RepID=A0A7W7SKD2_9ACTN|nr:sugar ABC transporter substrate-binding protein [Kitasatospora gansuensis]MBB4951697.1 multiple sugar transport system substrate-binding protein [Kitasatospora gansuensis]